jgi:GTP cyclohydrolase IA
MSGSSSSSDDSRRRRRERKEKKRKNGDAVAVNGAKPSAFAQRRNSLAKASRDPRDEPIPKKRRAAAQSVPEEGAVVKTRSPSPVIDFDGLSRPSTLLLPVMVTLTDGVRSWDERAEGGDGGAAG